MTLADGARHRLERVHHAGKLGTGHATREVGRVEPADPAQPDHGEPRPHERFAHVRSWLWEYSSIALPNGSSQ